MKLQDILNQYHQDSARASDIARNLNYALIGVVWILSKESVDRLGEFKWSLFLIVISLSSDFLQYFVKGVLEKCHFDKQEKNSKDENGSIHEDYNAALYPKYIQVTAQIFYYLKLCLMVVATILILCSIPS